MSTNERIALALGWQFGPCDEADVDYAHSLPHWWSDDECYEALPDYEHSLDALLEPLGVLRERGMYFDLRENIDALSRERWFVAYLLGPGYRILYSKMALSPSEALALVVAEALEAK